MISFESSNTKRIAKNTLMLYFRQILIMLVSLYTVRVVLNVLGAEDYGIYTVVAGVVTMFSFLNSVMATASQRYFSFDLGKNDIEHLNITFSVTFQIYIFLAFVIILFAETFGVWFVNNKLVIPCERLTAANWIFQAAILTFLLKFITTPYMACIIAHENMNVYAYVSIVEVVLNLAVAFLVIVSKKDKLIVYGFLLTIVALVNTTIYRIYCRKCYVECKFRLVRDDALFKEIIGYSWWNLFGSIATVFKNQGVSFILNMFFGPVLNAAQGVATQVRTAVSTFANNFMQAVRPQIVKNYASKDYVSMWNILYLGCKISFFLNLIFFVPLLSNVEYVLMLWVKNVPNYTVVFVKLLLIDSLIESISQPMAQANQATGKIALYQVMIGIIQFLNLPLAYIFLKLGFAPYIIYIVSLFCTTFLVTCRLLFLKKINDFKMKEIVERVFIPCFFSSLFLISFAFFVSLNKETFISFLLDVVIKVLISVVLIFIIGFNKTERTRFLNFIVTRIRGKRI